MDKFTKDLMKALRTVRNFPSNTCPYSLPAQVRHASLLARGRL